MMVFKVAFVFALLFFCVGIGQKKFSNAIFNFIWLIMFVALAFQSKIELRQDTVICLLLMFFAVNFGMAIYWFFCGLGSRKKTIKKNIKIERDSEIINIKFFKVVLLLCTCIIFLYFMKTIIAAGGFNLNDIRNINSSSSEYKAFSGLIDTIAFYFFAEPLFLVSTLMYVYMFFSKQINGRAIHFLYALLAVLYFITTAGRIIIVCMLCFIFAAYITLSRRKQQRKIKFGRIVLISLSAFLILNLMTLVRTNDESTFIQQAIDYTTGSIYHMDTLMPSIERHRNANSYFGTIAYGGFLYYPIKLLNVLLGTSIKNSSEILQYMQKITVIVIGNKDVYFNALAPNAFYYYFDSHYVGVVLFSLISGFVAARAEKLSQRGGFMNSAFLGIVYYCLVFSPMGSQCWKPLIPVTCFWLFFLKRWVVKKNKKDIGEEKCQ